MSEFQYERQAMNGEEMPNGIPFPDQILYLSLRSLYDQYKKGVVNREMASREKKKLLMEYEACKFRELMGEVWVQIIKETELARAECRKNPCPESAKKLIEAIERVNFDLGGLIDAEKAQKGGNGNG